MRLILFFDLPTDTQKNRHDYSVFVKEIKKMGFYMLQESVYIKLCIDSQACESSIISIKSISPSDGSICVLSVTEKQFSSMKFIIGDNVTDVINSDERKVEL